MTLFKPNNSSQAPESSLSSPLRGSSYQTCDEPLDKVLFLFPAGDPTNAVPARKPTDETLPNVQLKLPSCMVLVVEPFNPGISVACIEGDKVRLGDDSGSVTDVAFIGAATRGDRSYGPSIKYSSRSTFLTILQNWQMHCSGLIL